MSKVEIGEEIQKSHFSLNFIKSANNYEWALAIIAGIGALIIGVGVVGYLQVGALSHINQIPAIATMVAGGGISGMAYLALDRARIYVKRAKQFGFEGNSYVKAKEEFVQLGNHFYKRLGWLFFSPQNNCETKGEVIMQLLIKNRESIKDKLNQALGFIYVHRDKKLIKVLLALGADVNSLFPNPRGVHISILHAAVANKDIEIVKFLIANGAKVDLKDGNGNTPYDVAEDLHTRISSCKTEEVARYLEGFKGI